MSSSRISVIIVLSVFYSCFCLAAEPIVTGNPSPSVESLINNHPGTSLIFAAESDGSARHIQSGFICPAKLPNTNLWSLQIFGAQSTLGMDVGCDYGRVAVGANPRAIESKFTIFLVKTQPSMSLETAFKQYLDEMHAALPNGKPRGEVIHISGNTGSLVPKVLSAGEQLDMGNRKYMNEVAVSIVNGWIVELRSTYPTEFAPGDPTAGLDFPVTTFVWANSVRKFADAQKD